MISFLTPMIPEFYLPCTTTFQLKYKVHFGCHMVKLKVISWCKTFSLQNDPILLGNVRQFQNPNFGGFVGLVSL